MSGQLTERTIKNLTGALNLFAAVYDLKSMRKAVLIAEYTFCYSIARSQGYGYYDITAMVGVHLKHAKACRDIFDYKVKEVSEFVSEIEIQVTKLNVPPVFFRIEHKNLVWAEWDSLWEALRGD